MIDDTYNANPASMKAAFQTLATLARGKRAILVTGDMRELGAHAESLHREIGRAAAGIRPDAYLRDRRICRNSGRRGPRRRDIPAEPC